ncbi:hypothetical protein [Aerococcus urinaeequi]|uniref:hypothetical protein n=1 Tax=Aerococcus urinaeequi TaxID=51665 RepID=UPI003D6B15CC
MENVYGRSLTDTSLIEKMDQVKKTGNIMYKEMNKINFKDDEKPIYMKSKYGVDLFEKEENGVVVMPDNYWVFCCCGGGGAVNIK